MQDFGRRKPANLKNAPINRRVGLVRTNLARDKNVAKKARDREVLQDGPQSPIKVRNDRELKTRSQFLESAENLGIKRPDPGFGKVSVSRFEEVVAVER